MRFKPSKKELFANNSSLGIQIDEDNNLCFGGYIFDRHTNLIIADFKVRVNTIPKIDDTSLPKKRKSA